MARYSKKEEVNQWIDAISGSSKEVERFYRKDDAKRETPFEVVTIQTHFITKEVFVHFQMVSSNEEENYVLDKDTFMDMFVQVIETI